MHRKIIHCTCSDNVQKHYTGFSWTRWHLYEWSYCSWVSPRNHTFIRHANTHTRTHTERKNCMPTESHSGTTAQILCTNIHRQWGRSNVKRAAVELLVCCKGNNITQSVKSAVQACLQPSVQKFHLSEFPLFVSCSVSRSPERLTEVSTRPRGLRVNSVWIHDIWVVKLLLISLARMRRPMKIYSWSNHSCQTCWRFSGGTRCLTAGSLALSLDESGLHSWKHFLISIVVLCRSAAQGLILHLAAYLENYKA